jgi:hypothetical protein
MLTVASFAKLDPKFNVPSRTIIACLLFNLSFGLLYLGKSSNCFPHLTVFNDWIGPTVAFNAYTASTTIFLNVSYAAPILMVMIRGRGVLQQEVVAYRLGRMGFIWNSISILFVTFICVVIASQAVHDVKTNKNQVSLFPSWSSSQF